MKFVLKLVFLILNSASYIQTKQQSNETKNSKLRSIQYEKDFSLSGDNLNRLKSLFLRNGMKIFSNHENDEYFKPPRNPQQIIPADELFLDPNNKNSLNSNLTIIQGDIIVPNTLKSRKKRRIITNNQYGNPTRWPKGIIPYEFDVDANELLKSKFYSAIKIWHQNTCIRFEPYSELKHPNHKSKILIRNRGHCAARVGYSIDPNQKVGISDVYLPEHCPLGSVIHELGHVIGFRHEHTRYDRTDHVKIHYERMQSSQRPQYDIMDNGFPGYFGIYYDLFSIMHYSSQNGLIESNDDKRSFLMGQRFTLSFSDIKMANKAYDCNENCSNREVVCQNEGFVDATCKCRCPEHITGVLCETIITKQPKLKSSSNPNLTCNFEKDFCDWSQEQSRDSEEFVRNTGYTKTQINYQKENTQFRTGPQLNEEDRKDSTYIYLNSFDQSKAYANSILVSPQILVDKIETRCLKFYYHMYSYPLFKLDAPDIGKLSLKLRNSLGDIIQVWERYGSQGEDWQKGEVEFKLEPPHTVIFFEAEVVDWKYGDIAIDDIEYINGPCKENSSSLFNSVWSSWSSWSDCSKMCNGGIKIRERFCLSIECLGDSKEYMDCNTERCDSLKIEEWNPWSECTVSCGYGHQIRFKKCFSEECKNLSKEIRPCFMGYCQTININEFLITKWSDWSEWTPCNENCTSDLTKYSYRFRNCIIPKINEKNLPIKNECIGANKEIKACENIICNSNTASLSDWSEWSECSTNCGYGVKTRSRKCYDIKFPCDNKGFIEERNICSSNKSCSIKVFEWSSWSEWSECSVDCGQGFTVRTRECLTNSTCQGLSKEIKLCTTSIGCKTIKLFTSTQTTSTQLVPLPSWSDWSEWSECFSKDKCGLGIKVRKRYCLLKDQLVQNKMCLGPSFNTSDCVIQTCFQKQINDEKENQIFWSSWSNCSIKCGTGISTRYRKCFTNESDCFDDKIFEQKTCVSYIGCENEPIYMECSFDKKEYCPLEQIEKGNSQWEIETSTLYYYSKYKVTPSPKSGGNFVCLTGEQKKSSMQTPIVSNERIIKGQCLSFYYFLNGYAKFEITKVNLDGSIQLLYVKENSNLAANKWKKVLLSVQSLTDYFIEFTAITGNNLDSMVAIDDIEFIPIENCLALSCSFDNDLCKPNSVLKKTASNKIWIVESFLESNLNYLRADISQVQNGISTFYGFPIISPEYSTLCLSFRYLLSGLGSTELRVGLVQDSSVINYIWKENTLMNKIWKKALIDFTVENSFQIFLETLKIKTDSNNETIEIVAVDNLKISYGYCSFLKNNIEFEQWKFQSNNRYKRDLPNIRYSLDKNLIGTCGGVFDIALNESIILQSPGYPVSYNLNQYCSYLIKTEKNNRINITLLDLDLEDNERHDQCIDYLEVRYFAISQPGPKYCGKIEKYNENGVHSILSYKNTVLLIFASDWAVTKVGFKLEIKGV